MVKTTNHHGRMIFDYKALYIAFPILIHYSAIIKNLPSSKNSGSVTNSEPGSKLTVNLKRLCLLFRANMADNWESQSHEKLPDIYSRLTNIISTQVSRHPKMRNQIKVYLDADLTVDPRTQTKDINFQLKLSFFHNNILNKFLDNIEGNIHSSFENGEKNTQIRMKAINIRASTFDVEILQRFIVEYSELHQNFGKSLLNNLSRSSGSQVSKKSDLNTSQISQISDGASPSNLECLRFHVNNLMRGVLMVIFIIVDVSDFDIYQLILRNVRKSKWWSSKS